MSGAKKFLIIPAVLLSLIWGGYTLAVDTIIDINHEVISIETMMDSINNEATTSEASHSEEAGHGAVAAQTFLWIAIILLVAKLSSLVERFGQPAVLGELLVGVLLGNLVLLGINFFEPIKHDSVLSFLSELGVVILLFQIGLESNIEKMKSVGGKAFLVAILGVVFPFILGAYIVGPWLMPGLSTNASYF